MIFGDKFGRVHPLLYALLPKKDSGTYRAMFQAIQGLGVEAGADNLFSCDYEVAVIQEFQRTFPAASVVGLFHFSQNLSLIHI